MFPSSNSGHFGALDTASPHRYGSERPWDGESILWSWTHDATTCLVCCCTFEQHAHFNRNWTFPEGHSITACHRLLYFRTGSTCTFFNSKTGASWRFWRWCHDRVCGQCMVGSVWFKRNDCIRCESSSTAIESLSIIRSYIVKNKLYLLTVDEKLPSHFHETYTMQFNWRWLSFHRLILKVEVKCSSVLVT